MFQFQKTLAIEAKRIGVIFPSKFKIGLLYYKYFIPNIWKPIQPLVFGSNTAGNN